METVGILSLPDELLCDIGRYLSMNDILSCSMSCHRLRSALNDNSIWKGFLHSEDLTVFEEKELPNIDIPLQKKLSPLCSNRLHLIRKVKILNNWTHGRCSSEVIQEDYGNTTKGKRRLSSDMSMYRDSFVFLVAKFENFSFVELWDIKGKPFRLTHIKYQSVDKVQVVGDNLLICVGCRTYVHEICIKDNALPLKYVLYENDKDVCLSSLDIECSHKNKTSYKKCPFWFHKVYKQFLISNNTNKILIWDFQKSKKVITYNFPCAAHISVDVDNSYGSYVLVKPRSTDGTHVEIINIFKEQSLKLKSSLDIYHDHIVLQDSYFVVFGARILGGELTCSVYNIKSCKLISQNFFPVIAGLSCHDETKIVNGSFALTCQNSSLTIVDAKTLVIIHTIECHVTFRFMIVYQFNVLSKLFVGVRDSSKFNIWNVERKFLLPSLPFFNNEDLLICFNKWSSKAVCYDREMGIISVLNFSK